MNIDIELLREDLINYLGCSVFTVNPAIMLDLEKVRYGSDEEVIDIALTYGIDLNNYLVYSR